MSRSHPPSLLRSVERTLGDECRLEKGARILAAVSGGPDSMALLHALARLREGLDFSLVAAGIDHGLRPEAKDELEIARAFAEGLGVPFESATLSLEAGSNLQARAREARYGALRSILERRFGNEAFVATGHHRDDRAETVLLRLLRGVSLEGLGVLPPRAGDRLRPLVRVSRAAIEEYLERHAIPFSRDPSNESERFSRVRVRRELMPLLRELSPGVVEHLNSLADEALASGEPLGLAREERNQLRRALRDPKLAIDLRLGHGLRLFRGQ